MLAAHYCDRNPTCLSKFRSEIFFFSTTFWVKLNLDLNRDILRAVRFWGMLEPVISFLQIIYNCFKIRYETQNMSVLRSWVRANSKPVASEGFIILGFSAAAGRERPVWSPPKLYEDAIDINNTTALVSWFGRFRSLIIVIWELPALLNSLVWNWAIGRECYSAQVKWYAYAQINWYRRRIDKRNWFYS